MPISTDRLLALTAACLLWIASGFVIPIAACAAPAETDAEAKLLQGEILELSRGDLDGAMAIYRTLIADESVTPSVRAKALLQLASCHRKRGELEPARQLLERLVQQHASQSDLIESARGLLREIEQGHSDNSAFDWIEELLSSPEIQARIFDHVMALASNREGREDAHRQLVALGPLAVPALEKFLASTQSEFHRREIARILVTGGRFDSLPILLEAPRTKIHKSWIYRFSMKMLEATAQRKSELLEALGTQTTSDPDQRNLISALRLACGATDRFRADLEGLNRLRSNLVLEDVLLKPAGMAARALAALPPNENTDSLRSRLMIRALKETPDQVSLEQVLSTPGYRDEAMFLLERHGRVEDVLAVARKRLDRNQVVPDDLSATTAAKICLEQLRWVELQRRTRESTEVTAIWVEALRKRKALAPEFTGAPWGTNEPWPAEFFTAIETLLHFERDPITQTIAIEYFAGARKGTGPAIEPTLLEMLESNSNLEIELWATVFDRFAGGWDVESTVIERLDQLWSERSDRVVPFVGRSLRGSRDPRFPKSWRYWEESKPMSLSSAVLQRIRYSNNKGVFEHALKTRGSDFSTGRYPHLYGELIRFANRGQGVDRSALNKTVSLLEQNKPEGLETRKEALRTAIAFMNGRRSGRRISREPEVLAENDTGYLRSLIIDPELPVADRASFLIALTRQKAAPEAFVGKIDWESIFRDQALFEEVSKTSHIDFGWSKRLEEKRAQLIRLALENPSGLSWVIDNTYESDPSYVEILQRSFSSDSKHLRQSATIKALKGETVLSLPFLWQVAKDNPERSRRKQAIERLVYLADPSSIAPLTALLDDADFSVRAAALEALESIKSTLAKQDEWRKGQSD